MKLTPLDIHHKEFHRAIRGYNEEEVDKFLDEVAEEFERLFKENIELKEQVDKVKQELDSYSGMQKTLQNTLLTAQKSAEDVVSHAKKEAELILRDAEVKAKEIIQEAYDLKNKYESTLGHLKQAEQEFRSKFKSMLESYMRIADSTAALAEIGNNVMANDKPSAELERIMAERLSGQTAQAMQTEAMPSIEIPSVEIASAEAQANVDMPIVETPRIDIETPRMDVLTDQEQPKTEFDVNEAYVGETYTPDSFNSNDDILSDTMNINIATGTNDYMPLNDYTADLSDYTRSSTDSEKKEEKDKFGDISLDDFLG